MAKIIKSILISLCLIPSMAIAEETKSDFVDIIASLARIIPEEEPDSVIASPIQGLYEITYGPDVFYMTRNGQFVIQGDVIDLESKTNITDQKRIVGRARLIESIDKTSMIIFAPKKTKHVVTVFTDVDCSYCRKMHGEMAEYNDLGIEIRYLAYPRSGVQTKSYFKAVSVWCAEDPHAAMTLAKSGGAVESKNCDHPVREHMVLAGKVGLSGTPTLVLENGRVMPGYVPPDQLIEVLEDNQLSMR